MKKILHLTTDSPIIPRFMEFLAANNVAGDHQFCSVVSSPKYLPKDGVDYYAGFSLFKLAGEMRRAEKILLHGLFEPVTLVFLFLQPWLLRKCYWFIWGHDLYTCQDERTFLRRVKEFFRRPIIRRCGNLVTYIRGDFDLAKEWYGARGRLHKCFFYPSNLYKDYVLAQRDSASTNILTGNSADPANNHLEIFNLLLPYKDQNIKIFCPLSYGEPAYAEQVLSRGQELFGDKFIALLDFIPFEKYLKILAQIDVAVFAHKKQQGMGNTINLLGLGKKVFIRSDVTQWQVFQEIGVKVFDLSTLDIVPLDRDSQVENHERIKAYFSEANLVMQLEAIIND